MSARFAWVAISALVAVGCDTTVNSDNPYDPGTPPGEQAKAILEGQVLGADWDGGEETPLEGAEVSIVCIDDPELGDSATTGSDGLFSFEELMPGRWTIEVFHAQRLRQAPSELALGAGERRSLTIVLDPIPDEAVDDVGRIYGVVHKSGELVHPVEQQDHSGIVVEVEDTGVRTVTNMAGDFDLFLNAGTYNLLFSAKNYNLTRRNGIQVVAEQELEIPDSPVVLDPNPGSVSGQVLIEGAGDSQHGDVTLSLFGSSTGTSAADGSYLLTGVAAGTYTMTAAKEGYDTETRMGITVVGGHDTSVPLIELRISRGSVQGNVQLAGRSDHSGVLVELTGSTYTALTNSLGDYFIDDIAVGTYELTASMDGYVRGVVAGVTVEADRVTQAESLVLSERQGDFDINGGAHFTNDALVSLTLDMDDAVEMRISEDPTFTGVNYVPYDPNPGFTLSSPDGEKTVYVQYKDSNGIESQNFSSTIVLDTQPPHSASLEINGGAQYSNNPDGMVTLSFGALDDTSGVEKLRVSNDGVFDTEVWQDFVTAKTHTLMDPLVDGAKTVYVQYRDFAENITPTAVEAVITLDRVEPVLVSFTINCNGQVDAAACNSPVVELEILATGAAFMAFSNQPGFPVEVYEPYGSSRSYFLPAGDGNKSVWVKLMDQAGNKTVAYSDDVALDTTAPEMPMLTLSGVNGYVTSPLGVGLSVTVSDADVDWMRVSVDGTLDTEPWVAYLASSSVDLPSGDGLKTVFAQVKDGAGNSSQVSMAQITVDGTDPQIQGVVVGDGSGWVRSATGVTQVKLNCSDAIAPDALLILTIADEGSNLLYSGANADVVTIALGSAEVAKTVTVTCEDPAGNRGAAPAVPVSVDHTPPVVNSYTLNGGLADEPTNDASITVHLVNITDNFSGVQATALWETVFDCATANYAYPPSGDVGFTLSTGEGSRGMYLCARDLAGNVTSTPIASDNMVWLDTQPPVPQTLWLAGNAEYTQTTSVALSVTSSESGLQLQLQGDLDEAGTYPAASHPDPVTLNGVEGINTVTGILRDAAGNSSTPFSDSIVLDSQAPYGGSVVINGGAPFVTEASGLVTLDLVANDLTSGVELMRISNDGVFDTEITENYSDTKVHTLDSPGTEGLKTVYVHFYDYAGNQTASAAQASVTLDYNPPTASLFTLNGGAPGELTNNREIVINLTVSDAVSENIQVALAENSINCDTAPYSLQLAKDNPYTIDWTLTPGDGSRNIYLCARDQAGNTTAAAISGANSIMLDTTPPDPPDLMRNSIDNQQIELSWNPPGAFQFVLERRLETQGSFSVIQGDLPGDQTTYTDTEGLRPCTDDCSLGVRRHYRIRARDQVGNFSEYSIEIDAGVPIDPVLAVNMKAVPAQEREIAWDAPAGTVFLIANYFYEDFEGNTFEQPLAFFSTHLELAPSVTRFNESLVVRNGNSDASLTWESEFQFGSIRQSVDTIGAVGQYTALALDSAGIAHIAYFDQSNLNLKYLKLDGVSQPLTLDASPYVGSHASMAIDQDDVPHIAYLDGDAVDLKYLKYDGVSSPQVLDSVGFVGASASLDLDSAGIAHICYYDNSNLNLKYVRVEAPISPATLDASADVVGKYCDLAVDASDIPHIAYYNQTRGDLKYIKVDWVSPPKTVADVGDVGWQPSIAVDDDGTPHIVYRDASNFNLTYLKLDAIALPEIIDADNVGESSSIAIDDAGIPHVSYFDIGNAALKYIKIDGLNVPMTLDDTGVVGNWSSIAVDSDGNPHISYYDDTNEDLRYLRIDGTAPPQTLHGEDVGDTIGQYTSIAVDGLGYPHISYYERTGQYTGSLWYIRVDGVSAPQLIDDNGGSGMVGIYTSIAIDSLNRPHISHLENIIVSGNIVDGNLRYVIVDPPINNQILDSSLMVGQHSSIDLDSDDVPHISYRDANNGYLKYLKYDGVSTPQILDSSGNVGDFTSLALDGTNIPHICYHDVTNGNLMYMLVDGSNIPQVLDSDGNVGRSCSIGVDGDGIAHIGYYDVLNKDLKYTKVDGASTPLTLDFFADVGRSISLAVDSSGIPHIAYQYYEISNATNYLKYIKVDGVSKPQTIDQDGTVGSNVSIAVDANGVPHVSYFDLDNQNLMYLHGPFAVVLTPVRQDKL